MERLWHVHSEDKSLGRRGAGRIQPPFTAPESDSAPKRAAPFGCFSAVAIGAADFAFLNLTLDAFQQIDVRQHLGDMVNLFDPFPAVKFENDRVALPTINAGVSREGLSGIPTVLPEVGVSVFFDILLLILRVGVIPERGPLGGTAFTDPVRDAKKPVFPGEVLDSLMSKTFRAGTK